jgi:N-carbamoylputrescine amidase
VLLATVDLAEVDETRTHWPFLRDRRIDAYGDLTRRFVDESATGTQTQAR